jgi:hypothetical protein
LTQRAGGKVLCPGSLGVREPLGARAAWRAMPRYFFHLEHVRVIKDPEGSEHASLAAAKLHAVKKMAEALSEAPHEFWDADAYRMTVAEADGLVLFSIEMFANMAPATRGNALDKS